MRYVFIHGAGCTPELFSAQREAFPDALVPDLHTLAPHATSIAAYADAVRAYLAPHDEPFALAGSSMGAAIALELAAANDPRISAVVALGCGPKLRVAPAILIALETAWDAFVEGAPAAFFAARTTALDGAAMSALRSVGQSRTLADFRACNDWDFADRAGAIRVPALVLTGERDAMTPEKFGRLLADRIPGGELRILPGAGHLAMMESPVETNAALRAFVTV